jgi:uncharacterized lipoprotein
MKKLLSYAAGAILALVIIPGCSNGPSPEQQTREQQEARDTAKKQATFFNTSPPPASEPGR